jgi:hypothetical protein
VAHAVSEQLEQPPSPHAALPTSRRHCQTAVEDPENLQKRMVSRLSHVPNLLKLLSMQIPAIEHALLRSLTSLHASRYCCDRRYSRQVNRVTVSASLTLTPCLPLEPQCPAARQGAKPRPSLTGTSSSLSLSSNNTGSSARASHPSSLQLRVNA